ncbi:MAG: Asp-tRNA(Asn)/Glu-tRNA(Gln) amidotransferase subunit GatB [Anaerolineae bacterium]|nr:MAG: Asp-tRNA(Asn)/Glu-tRNA(Gln) amidotransferase subunit GatB [Anaerolineae bacterium]
MTTYEPVMGLEIHAVLETRTKMFCACPMLGSTHDQPNAAVCPVCAGMPGTLPVANRAAVEFALRVALALECEVSPVSVFARKSYFYPDLPKGYQISQYDQPLAQNGLITFHTAAGDKTVRIRRVHIEEDTGKLTHLNGDDGSASLVDLNRAGVPLLEIVSEPDLHSADDVRAYAVAIHSLLRALGVNSGDLEKGLFRIEPNISLRVSGSSEYGTRVEVKNLNSFRSLERAVAYEIQRQTALLDAGQPVVQQTLGWDDGRGTTTPQRSKEDAEDYRYFPEPDLPPLVVSREWLAEVRAALPELPYARAQRFERQYGLEAYDARVLTADTDVANYFEELAKNVPAKAAANWLTGEVFSWLNERGLGIAAFPLNSEALAALVRMAADGDISLNTAKSVLGEMLTSGGTAAEIVAAKNLGLVSDPEAIAGWVRAALAAHPEQVAGYQGGKTGLKQFLFGQAMRLSDGRADPGLLQEELARQLG